MIVWGKIDEYIEENIDNYVCFGSDEEICPKDNLYRIIGLFDDDKDGIYNVKLIKYDYTGSDLLGTNGRDYSGAYSKDTYYYKGNKNLDNIAAYMWNYDTNVSSSGSNNWATSELNKINLNTNYINYLNNINSKWVDMIVSSKWYLGGMRYINNSVKAFYEGERNNSGYGSNPTIYRDEIGLMYPSDYGYASDPENWQNKLLSDDSSWIYMGLWEWAITPAISGRNTSYRIDSDGAASSISTKSTYAIRPVFYLKSNVTLLSGDGSNSNPFRLAI